MEFVYSENQNAAGVYKITNAVNDRIYIGSTKCFRIRWNSHARQLKQAKHCNKFLQRDYDKCGTDQFKFEILEVVAERDLRVLKEEQYLNKYYDGCVNCYNMCQAAVVSAPYKRVLLEETRKKISLALKGHKISEKQKAALLAANLGKKTSVEAKQNISNALKGRVLGEEHKAKISKSILNLGSKKKYRFVQPNGQIVEILNLTEFCKTNKLSLTCMVAVFGGKRKHHRGYKASI